MDATALDRRTAPAIIVTAISIRGMEMPRGIRLVLTVPDIGGFLGSQNIDGHASFRDNLFYSLNNHPGYNQIHIHRNGAGAVMYVCMKTTADGGGPGTQVAQGTTLFNEAIATAATVPARDA